jgi:hypothetical protein
LGAERENARSGTGGFGFLDFAAWFGFRLCVFAHVTLGRGEARQKTDQHRELQHESRSHAQQRIEPKLKRRWVS